MTKKQTLFTLLIFTAFVFQQTFAQQTVGSWQTSADQSKKFEKQTDVTFKSGEGTNSIKIRIDDTVTYQTIDGFGWCMTQGSAYWLMQLTQVNRTAILKELFSLEDKVNNKPCAGSASLRIALGASDLGQGVYTYQDDKNKAFSLAGPDLNYVIPVLKEIIAINPNITIMASPWTAPKWMKNNDHFIGGKLKTDCYGLYADYFLNYFKAMKAEGINIYAVTVQNEPLHDGNNPSMYMSKEEQYDFVENHLGPKIAASEFKNVRIIGYDHNCDNTSYPIHVATSKYVDGSAFHLYGGSIDAMTAVYNATKKNVYFTEQWTGGNADFASDFKYHIEYVQIGSVRNYAKTAYAWNVASDQNWDPHTDNGGCNLCKGALTINSSSKSITYQPTFYTAAQMSKVAKADAQRIKSAVSNDGDLLEVAFSNTDNTIGLVVFNRSGSRKTFDVVFNGNSFSYSLDGNTVASLIWSVKRIPLESVSVSPKTAEIATGQTLQLTATVLPDEATNKSVKWSSNNQAVASVSATGLVRGICPGTAVITATTNDQGKTDFCTVNVKGECNNPFPDIYNLISVYSNKGLDVKDKNPNAGAAMQQWAIEGAGGGDNQRWRFDNAGGDIYYIQSKFSNMYLTVNGMGDGAGVLQQPFSGDDTQKWEMTYLYTEGNQDVYKIINPYSSRALDVSGPSKSDGAEVHLWKYVDGDNQKWKIVYAAPSSATNSPVSESRKVQVYPNPASGIIHIDGIKTDSGYSYKIIGLDGRILQTASLNEGRNRIDISSLQPAYYIIQLSNPALSENTLLNFIKIK